MRPILWLIALSFVLLALAGCIDGTDGSSDDDGTDDDGPLPHQEVTWGELESATIRPGASLGGFCTFNFLFTGPSGNAYIGTAAHCTARGDRVPLGSGGPEIGTVVYDSDDHSGANAAVDFSLILLDKDQVQNAHPRMYGWDGPSGSIEAGEAASGDQVAIYGYGMVLGNLEETRPRFGVLMDEDGDTYRANMPAVNGDSGSPIIHVPTGKAFGIISHYGVGAVPPSTDEGPVMPFIDAQLQKAGFNVTLATS